MRNNSVAILSTPDIRRIAEPVHMRLTGKYKHQMPYVRVEVNTFPSGQLCPKVTKNIRNDDVYLFHSAALPDPNTGLMALFLTLGAIRTASAERINLILPFLPYDRQDRVETGKRESFSAKVVADLICTNDRLRKVYLFDAHTEQLTGFFSKVAENLSARLIQWQYFNERFAGDFTDVIVVTTDVGGLKRVQRFAKLCEERSGGRFRIDVGVCHKDRKDPNHTELQYYLGPDVPGKIVIVLDDVCDTGGSLIQTSVEMRIRGATEVIPCVTHAELNPSIHGKAEDRFTAAGLELVTTDSIPREPEYVTTHSWQTRLPTAPFWAEVIHQCETEGGSLSELYQNPPPDYE